MLSALKKKTIISSAALTDKAKTNKLFISNKTP